jgi:hypothetical protein
VCANKWFTLAYTPSAKANNVDVTWRLTFDTGSSGVTCDETSGTGGECRVLLYWGPGLLGACCQHCSSPADHTHMIVYLPDLLLLTCMVL